MKSILIKNISHVFHPEKPLWALKNVDFSVDEGEIFGLLGPNGGGKTTLFRIISTILKPTSGVAKVHDFDVNDEANHIRKKIGVLFQHPSLDKKLTLKENLIHQGHLYGLSGSTLKTKIDDLLKKFNLSDREDMLVDHLSGGMARRGEIAKSLLHNPSILFMDEPSSGLDPNARRELWQVLTELKKDGTTILLTTHLMEEAEKCDRVAILHKGELRAIGSPLELKSKIGGDVISIETNETKSLTAKIMEKFSIQVSHANGTIRIEKEKGHQFVPQLVESFPGLIRSVTVGQPTLDDVFVHETGDSL